MSDGNVLLIGSTRVGRESESSTVELRANHSNRRGKTGGVQVPFTYGSLPAEALYFKPAN